MATIQAMAHITHTLQILNNLSQALPTFLRFPVVPELRFVEQAKEVSHGHDVACLGVDLLAGAAEVDGRGVGGGGGDREGLVTI